MQKIAFVLVCLALAGHAKRLKPSTVDSVVKSYADAQASAQSAGDASNRPMPCKALTMLLMALEPAAMFKAGLHPKQCRPSVVDVQHGFKNPYAGGLLCPMGNVGLTPALTARLRRPGIIMSSDKGSKAAGEEGETDPDKVTASATGATESVVPKQSKTSAFVSVLLSAFTNAGALVCSGVELWEDVHELRVHHGHGTLLLVFGRTCNALQDLAGEIKAEADVVTDVASDTVKRTVEKTVKKIAFMPIRLLLRFLTSKAFTSVLTYSALLAAVNEVIADIKPGGHHGLLLLALHDMVGLARDRSFLKGRHRDLLNRGFVRLTLGVGALIGAALETCRSLHLRQIGAHHGVLLLAVSHILDFIRDAQTALAEGGEGWGKILTTQQPRNRPWR